MKRGMQYSTLKRACGRETMSVIYLIVLVLLGFLSVLSAAAYLARISYQELSSIGVSASVKLKRALTSDGVIAIEGVPGFEQIRRSALGVASAMRSNSVYETFVGDIYRKTLAIEFNAGSDRSSFSSKLDKSDGDNFAHLNAMQTLVDDVALTVSTILDFTFKPRSPFFGDQLNHASNGQDGKSWDSFGDIMQAGSYLEHVHSYNYGGSQKTGRAIQFHTDGGLFVLFAPALYENDPFDQQEKAPDFVYRDKDGRDHAIVVQASLVPNQGSSPRVVDGVTVHTVAPDTLVLMIGQGAALYLNPTLVKSDGTGRLRPVIHSMDMQDPGVRNWYGRMYLSPAHAFEPTHNMTHAQLRQQLVQQSAEISNMIPSARLSALPYGCGAGQFYTLLSQNPPISELKARLPLAPQSMVDCPKGTLYCWAMCLIPDEYDLLCLDSEVTCVDSRDQPVDPSLHSNAHQLGCVTEVDVDARASAY